MYSSGQSLFSFVYLYVFQRDVLEAIAGEFQAETEDERMAIERPDGSWFLDGIIAVKCVMADN